MCTLAFEEGALKLVWWLASLLYFLTWFPIN